MKRLCLMICVCGLILSGASTARANSWQVVYQTDFSSDPGWTTNSPSKMYWDQQKAKYHVQATGQGEYAFVPITYSPDLSYKLEFDIEVVRLDYPSAISFGLYDPDMREGEPVEWHVNYGRGDRGNGATLGYHGDSSSGYFPPPYAFLYEVNTVYHNVIVYDATAQKLTWQVTRISDGTVVADYSSPVGIGTFTGIDRICAKRSLGGATCEGYIDNVVLYSAIPEPAPLTGRIAFVSPHPDQGGRLWVMDASEGLSSKVEVPLPLNLWHVGCPEWSREGDWITFHAARSGEIRAGIYVVKPDGSGFCKVNPEGMDIGHPSFSPDGSQIVACTSSYGLYIFTKVGECDWLTEYLTHGVHPRWSPDGDKIAYSNWGQTYNSDIFVYDLNTNTSTQITNHGPGRAFIHAIWSPDGTKLAVVELDHNTDEQDIWIMGMDGLNPVNITESWATSAEVSPSWSPNGEYIVFQSDKSGNLDIWYTPVGHFAPTNITNSPEDEFYPAIGVTEPAEPNIAVSPLSHDFGDVELGTSSTVVVTISNVGDGNLTVSGIALETDFAITSAPPAAAIVVQPGATEDVEITYTPTVLGYNSAVLKITSDDPDEPVVEVQLSAVGIQIPLPPSEQIANILAFFNTSVDGGTLVGDGPGSSAEKRLNALRNMIEAAGDLIDDELFEEACQQLLDAYRRMDGQRRPPDFVTGEAVTELADMIQELMTSLGCE